MTAACIHNFSPVSVIVYPLTSSRLALLPSLYYIIILGGAYPFLFMFTKPRITPHRLKFGIKWSSGEADR
jgi:hypothetical protein